MTSEKNMSELLTTAERIEEYAEQHLFDGFGLMMSGIDSHTNAPFAKEFITQEKVPRRAMFDPWSFWTYEDSIMTAGHYIDGLVLKYEITGNEEALNRAIQVWHTCRDVFYQSQAYGALGCFLRPYGGFDEMEKFGEPLGTDQAAPLLCGAYRLMQHVSQESASEIVRVMTNTLKWYADQNYTYRYYKSATVPWTPLKRHGASFYLPALAFAVQETGEQRWRNDLDFFLKRQLTDPAFVERGLWRSFKQGGLLVLKSILGNEFDHHFTPDVLNTIYDEVTAELATYNEEGMLKRRNPESAESNFHPYMKSGFDRYKGLGFPCLHWVHGGRFRPRHETTVLVALAGAGMDGAAEEAQRIFALRQRVPEDFTHLLHEDYNKLPEAVHLYSCSVGAVMLDWWRNVWLLRRVIDTASS